MDDLISRKVLENVILRETAWFDNADEDVAYEAIQKVPAVDAVEVVRCGECEFSKRHFIDGELVCTERYNDMCEFIPVSENGYCDEGKRKEAHDERG